MWHYHPGVKWPAPKAKQLREAKKSKAKRIRHGKTVLIISPQWEAEFEWLQYRTDGSHSDGVGGATASASAGKN